MKKALVAAPPFTLSQFVDEGISPAALELRKIGVDQNRALNSFFPGVCNGVPAGFRCHALQGLQLGIGVSLKIHFSGSFVFSSKAVQIAIQRGFGALSTLIVHMPFGG